MITYFKKKNLWTGECFRESSGFPPHFWTSLSLFLKMLPMAVFIRNANRNLELGGKYLSW